MTCACKSTDANNCWAIRYHGHIGVSELTVAREGGPCECVCHEVDSEDDEWWMEQEQRQAEHYLKSNSKN